MEAHRVETEYIFFNSLNDSVLLTPNLLLTRESSVDFMALTYEQRTMRLRPMYDDMISKLPDVIIQQILSFLPLDEAVRTSILSTRWEFLWTSYPNLVFDIDNELDMNFVDRALFLRQSRVHRFSICFKDDEDNNDYAIHLRRWITDTVSLNVEELHLDLCRQDFGYFFEFPQCLLACASLTSFSLHSWWHFSSSSSINLSNLKNLVLEYVYFDAKSVANLFNGCPMLETTSLFQCTFMSDCRIFAPKLYKLVVEDPKRLHTLPIRNVMVFGPSLKSFHLLGSVTNFYCLNGQPSLDEAEISAQYQLHKSKSGGFFCYFYKLLKGLSLVKKLSLSSQALEALSYQGNLLADVPFFNNLSILSFVGDESIRLDLGDHNIGLLKILQNCSCLETLRFERGIILSANHEESERILDPVPPCFLSSLKTLEILFMNVGDYPNLFMNAAKILLERASILEKFIIHARKSYRVDPMNKEKLIKGLNELPRASKVCQFEFSDFKTKFI